MCEITHEGSKIAITKADVGSMWKKQCRFSNGRRALESSVKSMLRDNARVGRVASWCEPSRPLQAKRRSESIALQVQQQDQVAEIAQQLDYNAAFKRNGWSHKQKT